MAPVYSRRRHGTDAILFLNPITSSAPMLGLRTCRIIRPRSLDETPRGGRLAETRTRSKGSTAESDRPGQAPVPGCRTRRCPRYEETIGGNDVLRVCLDLLRVPACADRHRKGGQ